MEKEPKQLLDARVALSKAERDLGNPENLTVFERGITLLAEVIIADVQVKKVANSLAATYRKKAVSNVNKIIADADFLPDESFEHWTNVLKVFTEAGFDDDADLKACNQELALGRHLLSNLSICDVPLDQCPLPGRADTGL